MFVPSTRGIVGAQPVNAASPSAAPSAAPTTPRKSDSVTLSPAARERAAAAAGQATIKAAVHGAERVAEQLAREAAYNEDRPLLDMSEFFAGTGPARYAGSGEPVTADSEARFSSMAAKSREGRIALYESEKAKGTPAADIFDKLNSFMDAQSDEYNLFLNRQRSTTNG